MGIVTDFLFDRFEKYRDAMTVIELMSILAKLQLPNTKVIVCDKSGAEFNIEDVVIDYIIDEDDPYYYGDRELICIMVK